MTQMEYRIKSLSCLATDDSDHLGSPESLRVRLLETKKPLQYLGVVLIRWFRARQKKSKHVGVSLCVSLECH